MSRVFAIAAVICAIVTSGCQQSDVSSEETGDSPLGLLNRQAAPGFERAMDIRRFEFPADHYSHPTFQTEWWYFTGHLQSADDRHFGYQLTVFRFGLTPGRASGSDWDSNHLWLGQFAIADVERGHFFTASRTSREIPNLVGDQVDERIVRVEDFVISDIEQAPRLRATGDDFAIDVTLEPASALVLQGDRGLSAKGLKPGNASYYYSVPRLDTAGEVVASGETIAVTGLSWFDREWSTSVLSDDQTGWDWLALHLDDGSNLMVYRLRLADGSTDPISAGMLLDADGKKTRLSADQFQMVTTEHWRSSKSRARYPVGWKITVPEHGIELTVAAAIDDQEHTEPFVYWEGLVRATGTVDSGTVGGSGYLEMTGYH